ncbi:MAG: protein-L-isoaspartate(D-aspartate) O-methyltransferase [Cytophagales bacterium]|nr:protein-L-isoaspartate(D-aspartate) O-methyltransferase [Cytophagales bacterium]MDW8383355.1 protein-L-isoaspartate(D-aspartate) O-methyltransferase [Flammeovirgaceae bacterium]
MQRVDTYKHKGLRQKLVEHLIEKGISQKRVLEAISAIPRHFFIESAFESHAYQDKPFPIDVGQTISQPYTVARQTELLDVQKGEKILEIGTGSGYQTAILAYLGAHVVSIEYHQTLYVKAKILLSQLGFQVTLLHGDGSVGVPEYAPYDKILVTAAMPFIAKELLLQLKVGGYLVAPVGEKHKQRMTRVHKISENKFEQEDFGVFVFVPLLGKNGWENSIP